MTPKTKSSCPFLKRCKRGNAEITALTDAFCLEKLNAEYAQVCREMTATLARKRPSPLAMVMPKVGPARLLTRSVR